MTKCTRQGAHPDRGGAEVIVHSASDLMPAAAVVDAIGIVHHHPGPFDQWHCLAGLAHIDQSTSDHLHGAAW